MIRVMTEKGLSGNALKVIAIVAMTIDHLAWVGIETYEQAETPTRSLWAAFPVKTISKYKHLNKNIHEKDDALDLWSLV